MQTTWTELSPEEKLEERLRLWLSPQTVEFTSLKAKQAYERRVQRFIDVIQLRKPDRVPVSVSPGFFPAHYSGITPENAMYNPELLIQASRRFVEDFDLDTSAGLDVVSGRAFEILDYKLYKWPGHGVPSNTGYQHVEAEYMKADEYDAFIQDPD